MNNAILAEKHDNNAILAECLIGHGSASDGTIYQQNMNGAAVSLLEAKSADEAQIFSPNHPCLYCNLPLIGGHRDRQFCNKGCKNKEAYRRKKLIDLGVVERPLCIHDSFQNRTSKYRNKIDVIITDPPYGREYLPLYKDLATFALKTLRPGGWLLCLTGWGIDLEVRQTFNAQGLEFLTVCCFHMPSTQSKARKNSSTGWYAWQEHHKPLLWYQQPGQKRHHRRAGGNDLIEARVSGSTTPSMDQEAHEWEQDLSAFQEIVRLYTNGPDVILDPMMGWGTTLEAAVSLDRSHVIGIELLPERYAYACQRLGLTPTPPAALNDAAD